MRLKGWPYLRKLLISSAGRKFTQKRTDSVMSIVLNSKTYNFDGYDRNGVAVYTERSGTVPTSFSTLTFGIEAGKDVTKLTVRLSLPIVAATDSDCSCAGAVQRVSRMTWVFEEPNTGTTTERTDFEARISALTGTTQFDSFLINLVKPST